jgi:hypothetical protein
MASALIPYARPAPTTEALRICSAAGLAYRLWLSPAPTHRGGHEEQFWMAPTAGQARSNGQKEDQLSPDGPEMDMEPSVERGLCSVSLKLLARRSWAS